MANEAQAVSQEVKSDEPVNLGSGNNISPEDWDALESVTSAPEKKEKVKESEEGKVETKEEIIKDSDEDKEKKEKVEKLQVGDKQKESPKLYKFKNGEAEVSIPSDLKIQVKINGKDEDVTFEELRNEYSGKVAWSRKYNELDKERKTFYTEKGQLNSGLKDIHKMATTGNPQGAIFKIAEAIGAEPVKVWKDLVEQINAVMGVKPDPEAMKAQEKDWELNYLKGKNETEKANGLRQQELAQTETEVKAIQETHQVDNQTFVKAYDELCEEANKKGIDVNTITPAMVGEYIEITKIYDGADWILQTELKDREDAKKIYQEVIGIWRTQPKTSKEEMLDIVKRAFPAQAKKKSGLVKKVESHKQESKKEKEELISWDD